jgi:anion-transporting  ArsA/GET3 family ATPase
MLIKHSKVKNTGIIFELLVRQVTNDVLTKGDSPAVKIMKKHFTNSELAKEQRLYNLVNNSEKLTDSKAETIIQTLAESAIKINTKKINEEKYNLVKDIKRHYDLDNFFRNKISNYKTSAAVYTLLEHYRSKTYTDPKQVIDNKITLLEHLTKKEIINEENENIKLFLNESADIRILTYKLLIEKFNERYNSFTSQQKLILKEYINNINDSIKLKNIINNHFNYLKLNLTSYTERISDLATQIKMNESIKLIKPVLKNENPKEEHLINLLQYYELLSEIKKVS